MHAAKPVAPTPKPANPAAKEPLQMRVPVGIKRRFKSYAALKGVEPNELFVEIWQFYEANAKSHVLAGEGSEA
jgi:hypothetical protein